MKDRPVTFDIFCRVIDNLGDAGVSWRLSRQLAGMGHPVRLWIDDRDTLARFAPGILADTPIQAYDNITVLSWPESPVDVTPHDVVIEAFACTLPAWFIERIPRQGCLWINLEYLSAESWVESCHGLPSPQAEGQRKFFFFPGFTEQTGGLLREYDLAAQHTSDRRTDRRTRLKALLDLPFDELPADTRLVFLFCYPDAPLEGLVQGLAQDSQASLILAPAELSAHLLPYDKVQVRTIPYIAQEHFDTLLGCCDLNFVRGEDSFVRAIWTGLPMVWHIYKQSEDAHLVKLEAWIKQASLPVEAQAVIRAWNHADNAQMAATLATALAPAAWDAWQKRCRARTDELNTQADLATQLLAFYKQYR